MWETITVSSKESSETLKQMKPKQMREVIRIDEPKENSKELVFTRSLGDNGWCSTCTSPRDYDKIVYLGRCSVDGDMFAAYGHGSIGIFKGHLNSGKY